MRFPLICAAMLSLSCAAQAAPLAVPQTLLDRLNGWLDANTEYRDVVPTPRIELISDAQVDHLHGTADVHGGRIRGLYEANHSVIYLTAPWSANDAFDVSVLLHELVHHRQTSLHWYCPQAQEWRAYQIQAQWLAERDVAADFYWPAIVLQSSCAKRDIHPD